MHVTLGYIVLNEADLLAVNLKNHYDMADKIVIVEGADKRFPNATPEGLSIDATAEVVRSFPDPAAKITFIQHGWADDKSELRNRYCELAENGILIAVDADEFLSPLSAAMLLGRLRRLSGPGCVRIPHVHLWKNVRQCITGGYYSIPHHRSYRWVSGCRHPPQEHNHPAFPDGKLLCRHKVEVIESSYLSGSGGFTLDSPYWLHLGFCKPPTQIADKNRFYLNRGEAQTRPGTTRDRAAWFEEGTPEGCEVRPWAGWIPEVEFVDR